MTDVPSASSAGVTRSQGLPELRAAAESNDRRGNSIDRIRRLLCAW